MRMRKYAPILIVALAAGCGPCGYNRIVEEEQQVEAAWSQVENQLQRRADLIPNLVETVKGYARHEKGVFDEIANAHADVNTVYDAVARLRPNWLGAHGVTSSTSSTTTEYATVFVDGVFYGDLSTLRSLQAYHVADIRYYDITQSGAKYGIRGGSSGVIDVRTK